MKKYMSHVHDLLVSDSQALLAQYHDLQSRLDANFSGDRWVARSISVGIQHINDMLSAMELLRSPELAHSKGQAHKVTLDAMLSAVDWGDENVSHAVKAWRKNLDIASYDSIPKGDRKEIFDYFFRYDVHGNLDDEKTNHLSRGVNDPEYFLPPAIVNVALETASLNNWFGYSDSLGHIDTRKSIAELEQHRRSQSNISEKNTAVLQGGTAGLNAILSMIARGRKNGNCVVAAPNYAPIIDDVEHHFKPEIVDLDTEYRFQKDRLLSLAEDKDTAVVLLSIPHNPAGFRDFIDILPELHQACKKHGSYLIIDEIIYDEAISPFLDPVRYPNMILISSYSKTYNIPGLKLGHLVAEQKFVDQFYRHASTTYGSPPSFLYFTATCISQFEKAYRLQYSPELPAVIQDQVSDQSLLFDEFRLWSQNSALHKKFQGYVVDAIARCNRTVGIERIFGMDDPSPNIVLRSKGSGTAYKMSLDILATKNISAMPVECFSPPREWPKDIRVTISVKPDSLVSGFSQLVDFLDGRFAWESSSDWLHPDDKLILEEYCLYQHSEYIDLYAEPLKAVETLVDIFNAASAKPSHDLTRSVTLMGMANVWKRLPPENVSIEATRLKDKTIFSEETSISSEMTEAEIGLAILKNVKGKLPEAVRDGLQGYFHHLSGQGEKLTEDSALMDFVRNISRIPSETIRSASNLDEVFEISETMLSDERKSMIRSAIHKHSSPAMEMKYE